MNTTTPTTPTTPTTTTTVSWEDAEFDFDEDMTKITNNAIADVKKEEATDLDDLLSDIIEEEITKVDEAFEKQVNQNINLAEVAIKDMFSSRPNKKNNDRADNSCTQMCRSFNTDQDCPHGDKCRYAHSYEELRPRECRFEDYCRNVVFEDGAYNNLNCRGCGFIHPEETKENFVSRNREKVVPAPRTNKRPRQQKIKENTKVKDTDEVVLCVPKDLAMAAFKSMVEAGKTKFRIELV